MSSDHNNDSHSLSSDVQDIERSMATIVQASFSLLFKQLLDSESPNCATGFEPSRHNPAQIGDFGGSDFKRLAEKSRINRGVAKKSDAKEASRPTTSPTTTTPSLPQSCEPTRRHPHSLTDLLFGPKDRYFRSDGLELSKDIFPSDRFDSSQSTTVFVHYGSDDGKMGHVRYTGYLDGTEDELFQGMGLARMWKMLFG